LCAQAKQPWLIIGDMGELGDDAEKIHAQIGIEAKSAGVTRLFTLGELSRYASQSFGESAQHFKHADQLSEAVDGMLTSDCCVLIKGSRAMHMENVVDSLTEREKVH